MTKLGGVRVFIGIPSYSWTVSIATMRSLLADLTELSRLGVYWTIFDEAGNTEIGAARETIWREFLASDCTDLVFIDDDVCWASGGLVDLLSASGDVVAGVYPKRVDPLQWPVKWLQENAELRAVNGLLEVDAAPAGFMRITRHCAQVMHEKYGPSVFDNIRHESGRCSEDVSFCLRWRKLGGKVWIMPELAMGHIGKKMFSGCIGDWLRSRT